VKKEGAWCGGGSVVLLEVVCCGGSGGGNDRAGADSVTIGWLVILIL